MDGQEITRFPAHVIAKKGIAYLPQTDSTFTQLKVSENLKMAGYTVEKSQFDEGLRTGLQMFPVLANYMTSKVQNLSGGERQMVAMTMALIRKPAAIMLDEPTANLSPKLAAAVLKNVASMASDLKMAVLLVEQNARKALEIGNRAYLLVGGKKVFDGPAQELLEHKELAQMYLGVKTADSVT